MDILFDKIVKTRKIHTCHQCFKEFNKYTYMRCNTIVNDGDIYTIYICEDCEEKLKSVDYSDFDDNCIPEGYIYEIDHIRMEV